MSTHTVPLHAAGWDPLPGFEHVRRFYDPRERCITARVLPGEFYVSGSPQEEIVTTLGSCIAACIRDPLARFGGMNHFLLPDSRWAKDTSPALIHANNSYGLFAMESLINKILQLGGRRDRLEVKVTGGGRIGGCSSVGDRNIQFIRDFLALDGLRCLAEDVGGPYPRKVRYDPVSGRLLVKKLAPLSEPLVLEREAAYRQAVELGSVAGEVELF